MHPHLIIGLGLAGISLTEQLIKRGKRLVVFDQTSQPSSSAVATGMANPIVFKRLNKSWMIDDLRPAALKFYRQLEQKLEVELVNEVALEKWITSNDYRLFWNNRVAQPEFTNYLSPIVKSTGAVKQVFLVDCPALAHEYKKYLQTLGAYRDEAFDAAKLQNQEKLLSFKSEIFQTVTFCEGSYASENPMWSWLPFKLAKGDWVTIETKEPVTDVILNNVVNIIPIGSNRYKLSSTFEWETMSWENSPAAAAELTAAFEALFNVEYKILDQKSGLRPSSSDRRPYLGEHPRLKNHYIFNGFGSKGVLLAPYFSEMLAQHIIDKKPIIDEVNIKRHIRRFQAANP